MNKFLLSLAIFSSLVVVNPAINVSSDFYARSYVVIDGYTNEVLEGKDYHLIRSVASISKIMTAIIAIESDKNFYVYTVKEDVVGIEGSSVYLKVGEQYRLIDLIYGLLLRSGNDAAYAIASFVSQDTNEFVTLMNKKAKEIGLQNTIFNNPCGLDIYDEGNLSTAYDIALLMKYCLENELFAQIIKTKEYRFDNKVYLNKNKLLYSYEYLIGGKTGYTSKARRTLVTAANKDNQYLVTVTLDSPSDYSFHKAIYESYFDKYKYVVFLYKGKNYIDEFVFVSDKIIGLRLDKEIAKNGIKKYFINPYTKTLIISFIDKDKIEYHGGSYQNVKLI